MKVSAKIFKDNAARRALATAYKLHFNGVDMLHEALKITNKEVRATSTRKSILPLFKALRFGKEDLDMEELDKKLKMQLSIISDDYGEVTYEEFVNGTVPKEYTLKGGTAYLIPGKTKLIRRVPSGQPHQRHKWREDFASAGITIV